MVLKGDRVKFTAIVAVKKHSKWRYQFAKRDRYGTEFIESHTNAIELDIMEKGR